jgi:hypothetical protein
MDMPRVTDNLRDARTLAEFSNLEPAQVEYFRNNYPDFVPQGWWEHKNGLQWRKTQGFLRHWWGHCFIRDISEVVQLVLSVFNPDTDLIFGGQFDDAADLPTFAYFDQMSWGAAPFQRAVLYLFENPWRARFCAECNERFVAAEPKTKFCTEKCSHNRRIKQEKKWWDEHGPAWRRSRFQRLRRQKPPGRATRDTKRRGIKD